ncbi:MAG: hypothetical protein MZV64_25115 [Ignavibacteriales bacterium]|nr:hypothetical protein [Ignavibacteriales bacterium]
MKVVELTPLFLASRNDPHAPLFLPSESHWTPGGIALATAEAREAHQADVVLPRGPEARSSPSPGRRRTILATSTRIVRDKARPPRAAQGPRLGPLLQAQDPGWREEDGVAQPRQPGGDHRRLQHHLVAGPGGRTLPPAFGRPGLPGGQPGDHRRRRHQHPAQLHPHRLRRARLPEGQEGRHLVLHLAQLLQLPRRLEAGPPGQGARPGAHPREVGERGRGERGESRPPKSTRREPRSDQRPSTSQLRAQG